MVEKQIDVFEFDGTTLTRGLRSRYRAALPPFVRHGGAEPPVTK
jgi:hypothetical protein